MEVGSSRPAQDGYLRLPGRKEEGSVAGSAGVGLASENVSQVLREAPGYWGMGRPTEEVGRRAGQEIILHLLSAYSMPGTRTRAPPAVTSNPSMAMRKVTTVTFLSQTWGH